MVTKSGAKNGSGWAPKVGAKLSPQETRLAALISKGIKRTDALFRAIIGKSTKGLDPRLVQQRIGSIATRYNIKRGGTMKIVAGPDRTYQFRRVQ